jgi:hypothetical protein
LPLNAIRDETTFACPPAPKIMHFFLYIIPRSQILIIDREVS